MKTVDLIDIFLAVASKKTRQFIALVVIVIGVFAPHVLTDFAFWYGHEKVQPFVDRLVHSGLLPEPSPSEPPAIP